MRHMVELATTIGNTYIQKGLPYLENIESCSNFSSLRNHMQNFTFEDLHLDYDRSFFYNPNEPMKCMLLSNIETCLVALFFCPAGMDFPLHDHPGSLVHTKMLDGTLEMHSYQVLDYAKQTRFQNIYYEGKNTEPACIKELEKGLEVVDLGAENLGPGDRSFLTPKLRNLHSTKAVEDCCGIDIFVPHPKVKFDYVWLPEEGKVRDNKRVLKAKIKEIAPQLELDILRYEDFKKKYQHTYVNMSM